MVAGTGGWGVARKAVTVRAMNVFTDYAETHWVPINADMVTVQTVDAAGKRETHVLSVADALAQFQVKYPFVDAAQAADLFSRGG